METEKKTRHFAHKDAPCSLEIAQIVGTLILIKEIMDEGVSFTLPPIKCKAYEIYDKYTKLYKNDNRFNYYWNYVTQHFGRNDDYVEVKKSVAIAPDSMTVIKDTKKPKIIFNFKNSQCAIFIKTSTKKIKASQKDNNENSSVLEIDLQRINLNNISKTEVKKVIIGTENKQWLVNKQKGNCIKKQVDEIKKGYDKWVTENPPQNSHSFLNESITIPVVDTNISKTKVRKYTCSKCNKVYDENLFSIRGGTQENICRYCANPSLKK